MRWFQRLRARIGPLAGLDANAIVTERAVSANFEDARPGPRVGAAIAGSLGLVTHSFGRGGDRGGVLVCGRHARARLESRAQRRRVGTHPAAPWTSCGPAAAGRTRGRPGDLTPWRPGPQRVPVGTQPARSGHAGWRRRHDWRGSARRHRDPSAPCAPRGSGRHATARVGTTGPRPRYRPSSPRSSCTQTRRSRRQRSRARP